MNEHAESTTPACAGLREDLPLLAIGAVPEAEAAGIRAHLQQCAACRQAYEAHRGVLDLVRQESSPSVMLNSKRILAELQRRMSAETRASFEPAPAVTPRARILWLAGLAGAAAAACLVIGVLLSPSRGNRLPLQAENAGRAPVAVVQATAEAKPEPKFAGDRHAAKAEGEQIHYPSGMDGLLQSGAQVHFASANAVQVEGGEAAFYVPPGIEGFQVRGRTAFAQASVQSGARFIVVVQAGRGEAEVYKVAEGTVEVRNGAGVSIRVNAGQGTRVVPGGAPAVPEPIDVAAEFAWAGDPSARNLACAFKAESLPPANGLWSGTLVLHNAGSKPASAAGYHALGSNYQLEIRREGEQSSSFTKLVPRVLRKRASGEGAEPVLESSGEVALEPGQSYELEVDLRKLLREPGAYLLTAHYQVFTKPRAKGAETRLGYALRSQPLRVLVPAPAAKTR